jgi:hypothetical protein
MGDDEHGCINECTTKSRCPANLNLICTQHPGVVGQLCRCNKEGYRLPTNSLHNNTKICQG